MTIQHNPLKVVFVPGCFDNFDGTQEELDQLITDINNTVANMTSDELDAESCPLNSAELQSVMETMAQSRNLQ